MLLVITVKRYFGGPNLLRDGIVYYYLLHGFCCNWCLEDFYIFTLNALGVHLEIGARLEIGVDGKWAFLGVFDISRQKKGCFDS